MSAEKGFTNKNDLKANENANDLFQAIKQVAKEMAEAVKLSKKQVIKETVNETVRSIATNPDNGSSVPTNPHIQELSTRDPKGERVVKKNNRYYEDDDYNNDYQDSTYSNNKTFYEKEVDAHNSLQHRLELMRNKKIADEMKKFSNKPKISENSKRIIKQKFSNEKPIYERTDEILKIRNAKLEMLKNVYREIDLMEELENRTRFNPQGYASKEIVENFINDQMLWQKNKEERLIFIRSEIEKLEAEASRSFYKPTISKVSEDLAKKNIDKKKEKEVHCRLYNQHEESLMKKEILKINEVPTFTPTINKNPPKFNKKEVETKRNYTPYVSGKETNKKMNKSTLEANNKEYLLVNSPNEIDDFNEDPLLIQYRFQLERSHLKSSPVKKLIQNKTKKLSEKMVNKKAEQAKALDWDYQLNRITKGQDNNDTLHAMNSLYKLNVRDQSAWNKEPENTVVVVTSKFPKMK